MAKIVVLGGCGAVGRVAVKTLAAQERFSQIVIGDMNLKGARQIIAELGSSRATLTGSRR